MEFFQENTLVIANTLFQHRREDSAHGYQHIINIKIRLIIFFAASSIQSAKTRLGADCGSGHELLIAKFRLEESRENH